MTEKDKLAELHNFLKYDVEVSFLDGYVIDVAMDVISKHIERIKELEEANKDTYWIASDYKFENLKLEQQNKRYRTALKEINQLWERSTDATDDTNLAWKMSCEAHKALESGNGDN